MHNIDSSVLAPYSALQSHKDAPRHRSHETFLLRLILQVHTPQFHPMVDSLSTKHVRPNAESIFLHTPTYRVTFLAGETSHVSQGITRGVSRRRRRRRKRKRKRRRSEKNDLLAWSREEGCVVDTDRKRECHSQTE